jgi:hypothetical protein
MTHIQRVAHFESGVQNMFCTRYTTTIIMLGEKKERSSRLFFVIFRVFEAQHET